jgi:hypothetical protein
MLVGVLNVSARAGEPDETPPLSSGAIVTPRTDEPSYDRLSWIWTIEQNYSSIFPSVYSSLPAALPTPTLYQLRPTARNALAGSLLFGINPTLALLPTEKALDAPCDHPQQVAGDDVLNDMPYDCVITCGNPKTVWECNRRGGDWLKWLLSHWPTQRNVPSPEQNEGYIHPILPNTLVAGLTPVDASAEEIDAPLVPAIEALPMPQEDAPAKKKHKKHGPKTEMLPMPQEDAAAAAPDGLTCPWMRQQAADRHACQFADPEIGRSVLENFERLQEAEHLLDLARDFARDGCIGEALECCAFAENLCPGSPCAARAAEVICELYVRFHEPATKSEPGTEQQVRGLMKACRLLLNEGLHEQAAELARQAFVLDPERVAADPLIYKMHLLATTPAKQPAGSEEASEPPSCPYCPSIGKPIPGIVPAKKKSQSGPTTLLVPPVPPVDYEVTAGAEEASEEDGPSSLGELVEAMMGGPGRAQFGFGINADGSLRLCGECTCFGTIYHMMFSRGALAIWKTPDAAAVQP